jgi:hypothetical protein
LQREFQIFEKQEYKRLAGISVSHIFTTFGSRRLIKDAVSVCS